jgi:hypothetical protein
VIGTDSAKLVDAADVRVRQLSGDARLVDEHADELTVLGDVRQDALDRDDLIDARSPFGNGFEDLRHAADADTLQQQILPEGRDAPYGGGRHTGRGLGVEHVQISIYLTAACDLLRNRRRNV